MIYIGAKTKGYKRPILRSNNNKFIVVSVVNVAIGNASMNKMKILSYLLLNANKSSDNPNNAYTKITK